MEIVGRDAELDRLDAFVAALGDGASAASIRGGAGMGKTTLWREAAARAESAGARVVRSRCAEVEMPIAFGALADLIDPLFDDVAATLPPAQRQALAAAFGRGVPDDRPDPLVLAGAALSSLRALAAASPVVVAIDDVQWLDAGSRRTLAWALRRVDDAPVAVLTAIRAGAAADDPLALADTLPPERIVVIEAGPMSSGAVQHLIAARTGVHLPRPTLARVQRASGGNPLFALEFARSLAEEPRRRLLEQLSVPASLDEVVRARVAALPGRLRPVLEVVAGVERPTPALVDRVLDDARADALVGEAAAAEVLVVDGEQLRFAHPLLAAAVYHAMPAQRRRALHARLADVVDGVEDRARHAALAAERPAPETAALLEQAAAAAASRGALDAAAELGSEAARLTPAPDVEARRRRALRAAEALVGTGEFVAARVALDPLLTEDTPPGVRAAALLLRAECEVRDRGALVGYLREACEVASEPRQRWQALVRLAQHEGWISGDVDVATRRAREAVEIARAAGDASLVEAAAAPLRFYEALHGSADEPQPIGEAPAPAGLPWWHVAPAVSLGCRLMWRGDLGAARTALAGEVERQDRAGRDAAAGFARCWLSELEWRAGDWGAAEALALEATARLGNVNPTAFVRALLTASTGRLDETRTIAHEALDWAAANDERVAPPRFLWLLGLVDLARGEVDGARRSLADAQARLDAAGVREPGYLPVLPDLVESLVAADELDEARQVVDRLEAARHPWARAAADRSRAVLALAEPSPDDARALAAAAADAFAATGHRFDVGRALLVQGNADRRLGERRRAAAALRAAADVFTKLGAADWLAQAEDALRRASPRPRRHDDGLTAAEARVAALVAAGRKNREVAAELYTTVATVEAHLTRIYRKLGIRSRSDLVRLAARGSLESDE